MRGIQEYPTVIWKPTHESFSLRQDWPVYDKPQAPTALLPNWRQLIRDQPAVSRLPTRNMQPTAHDDGREEDDWEDMSDDDREEEDEDNEEVGGDLNLRDLDPDLLRSAIAANLSNTALTAEDRSELMESMMQMLAGGGAVDGENLLEALTTNLVNQVTEAGTDSSMGQWLSGQGVKLQEDEGSEVDEDREDSASVPPTKPSKASIPQESVATEPPAAPKPSEPATEELLDSEPKSTGKKRKQPTFDRAEEASALSDASLSNTKRAKKDTAKPPASVANTKAFKSNSVAPQKANRSEEKAAVKPKPGASTTAKAIGTKATRSKTPNGQTEESTRSSEDATKPTTRKRKAADEELPEEKPKRQLRNFAAPTASSQSRAAEPVKTTRSGRARK